MSEIEISRIPTSVQLVLTKLKFLKGLKRNCKLNISTLTYSENTYYESIKRLFTGESRKLTISFVENLIIQAIDILEVYGASEFAYTILLHLDEACIGLEILRENYANDAEISSRLETTIENVKFQVEKNRNFLTLKKPNQKLKKDSNL